MRHFLPLALLVFCFTSCASKPKPPLSATQRIAALVDPAKLGTLSARGTNPRVQKYVAQLWEAQQAGLDPAACAAEAVQLVGMSPAAAQLTVEAMLRNLRIASQLGCLTPQGLAEMHRGRAPTITLGPYAGDQLSVDHIIPFSLAPQLDHVIANLELMPMRMNMSKGNRMTERQNALAARLRIAGLL